MKRTRRILALLVLLVVVGFGIFWVIRRQAQTLTPLQLDDLTPLSVSLLPDDTCAAAAREMVEQAGEQVQISHEKMNALITALMADVFRGEPLAEQAEAALPADIYSEE